MCRQQLDLNVLGVEISFRPGADMDRVRQAAQMLEDRYTDDKLQTRDTGNREVLLTFLALGLADELLQMKKTMAETEHKLLGLLDTIEEAL